MTHRPIEPRYTARRSLWAENFIVWSILYKVKFFIFHRVDTNTNEFLAFSLLKGTKYHINPAIFNGDSFKFYELIFYVIPLIITRIMSGFVSFSSGKHKESIGMKLLLVMCYHQYYYWLVLSLSFWSPILETHKIQWLNIIILLILLLINYSMNKRYSPDPEIISLTEDYCFTLDINNSHTAML